MLPTKHGKRHRGRCNRLGAGTGRGLPAGMADLGPHMRAVRLAGVGHCREASHLFGILLSFDPDVSRTLK